MWWWQEREVVLRHSKFRTPFLEIQAGVALLGGEMSGSLTSS